MDQQEPRLIYFSVRLGDFKNYSEVISIIEYRSLIVHVLKYLQIIMKKEVNTIQIRIKNEVVKKDVLLPVRKRTSVTIDPFIIS